METCPISYKAHYCRPSYSVGIEMFELAFTKNNNKELILFLTAAIFRNRIITID